MSSKSAWSFCCQVEPSDWGATKMAGSFAATVAVHLGLVNEVPEERAYEFTLFTWLPAGGLHVDIGFLADPLSITMALFVTGVGALIHLYSVGYMHGDRDFHRFFALLNLFVFFMLILVLGDSLLLTFLGWEGVGLCSYQLISFWYQEMPNAVAGKKAVFKHVRGSPLTGFDETFLLTPKDEMANANAWCGWFTEPDGGKP